MCVRAHTQTLDTHESCSQNYSRTTSAGNTTRARRPPDTAAVSRDRDTRTRCPRPLQLQTVAARSRFLFLGDPPSPPYFFCFSLSLACFLRAPLDTARRPRVCVRVAGRYAMCRRRTNHLPAASQRQRHRPSEADKGASLIPTSMFTGRRGSHYGCLVRLRRCAQS